MKRQLLLIDGNSYIFRAFYGIRVGLTNKKGFPTNAIFGFKNMLFQLFKKENPSHCAVVFDAKGTNFRHELYPAYKANRDKAPEDLGVQFDPIHRLVRILNIPILVIDEVEADDVIGSLANRLHDQIDIKIISGDKDLTQLVKGNVLMYDSMKDFLFTEESTKIKFGVSPSQMHEFLALTGDSSDNIPGAAGIGPKTAVSLLEKYESVEGIYKHIDEIKGKNREKLIVSKENVEISLKLTQIRCDVPLPVNLEGLAVKRPQVNELWDFYREMDFKPDAFLESFALPSEQLSFGQEEETSSIDRSQYELVNVPDRLCAIRDTILKAGLFVIDLETTSLTAMEAKIVGIALAWEGGKPVYIPVGHKDQLEHTNKIEQLPLERVLEILQPLFDSESVTIVGQNIKYDLTVLENYEVVPKGHIEDTMIQSYLLNAESHRHNLNDLASIYLNHKMISYKDITGTGKKQISFDQVPLEEALNYAAEDADATMKLYKIFHPQMKSKELEGLYQELEIPICRVLIGMERKGVHIDREYLSTLSKEFNRDLLELEGKIYAEAGEQFNINSTKQLGAILFEKMGLTEKAKKTKSGKYSTDASVLETLAFTYPIAFYLLEYRKKSKLTNTYVDVLPTLVSTITGRVHTSYNQTVVATGRLSSSNPNLQNIPIKGNDGSRIRRAFNAEPGFKILSADYSQVELRLLAHLSKDSGLTEAFSRNLDIHRETAAAVYGVNGDQVTEDQRRAAKAINFGIIYGMGAYRLAGEIGVSNREAKEFIERYFERFPDIRAYIDETIQFAREKGYVKTMSQRRRSIPGILSQNHMARTGAERVAVNTTIQGSAADLIKIAMIRIHDQIAAKGYRSQMVMQVHDELVFEVAEEEVEVFTSLVKEIMQKAVKLSVPLLVDLGIGNNWQEAH